MNIAIYCRVSSIDKCPRCKKIGERRAGTTIFCPVCQIEFQGKHQDTENQMVQLRAHAIAMGWNVVTEFVDRKSAKNGERDQFKAMFEAAARKEFEIVLVWALDRFTREGILGTFAYIEKLLTVGCQFYSLTEPQFRTSGPAGELMIALAAWMAKQERVRISDRTKAGLAVARAAGRIGGRKEKDKPVSRIVELRREGLAMAAIATEVGLSKATVRRVCLREAA